MCERRYLQRPFPRMLMPAISLSANAMCESFWLLDWAQALHHACQTAHVPTSSLAFSISC